MWLLYCEMRFKQFFQIWCLILNTPVLTFLESLARCSSFLHNCMTFHLCQRYEASKYSLLEITNQINKFQDTKSRSDFPPLFFYFALNRSKYLLSYLYN